MRFAVDTNILVRIADPSHPMSVTAKDAVTELFQLGDDPVLFPQVLYEVWVVCTRPKKVNGLEMLPVDVENEIAKARSFIQLLPDTPAIFSEWERLVTTHSVIGKNAHDARLVAAMLVHGVTHILTFNHPDFARFPITAMDPTSVVAPPPTP